MNITNETIILSSNGHHKQLQAMSKASNNFKYVFLDKIFYKFLKRLKIENNLLNSMEIIWL